MSNDDRHDDNEIGNRSPRSTTTTPERLLLAEDKTTMSRTLLLPSPTASLSPSFRLRPSSSSSIQFQEGPALSLSQSLSSRSIPVLRQQQIHRVERRRNSSSRRSNSISPVQKILPQKILPLDHYRQEEQDSYCRCPLNTSSSYYSHTMEKEYEKDTLRMLERIQKSRSLDREEEEQQQQQQHQAEQQQQITNDFFIGEDEQEMAMMMMTDEPPMLFEEEVAEDIFQLDL